MITCKEVARLLGSNQVRELAPGMRLRLKLHLWMCEGCSRLAHQYEALGSAARSLGDSLAKEKPDAEPGSLEERVLRKLKRD